MRLPFELVSHIIYLSSTDNASLLCLSLVNQAFHDEAIPYLYAVSPPIRLGISMWGSSPMQFLQVIRRSKRHALFVKHVVVYIVAYDDAIIALVRALEMMDNIQTLEIRHIYIDGAHGPLDLTPTLFDNPKCKFRLKSLLWLSNRQQICLLRLGELIALHRETLEVLSVNFHANYRDFNHETNIRILTAVQCPPIDIKVDADAPQTAPTTRSIWPLPRLRTVIGSQEALNIFFPLVAKNNQITKLEIISPFGFPFDATLDPKRTFPRLIECIEQNSIRVLHIDFIRNVNLQLKAMTPYLPFLETLKLHQPILPINDALEPLKKLRTLSMTFKEEPPIYQAAPLSIFDSCPSLVQVEVGFPQDGEDTTNTFLYTRWWKCSPKGTGRSNLAGGAPEIKQA